MLGLFGVAVSFFVLVFFISCGPKDDKKTEQSAGAHYVTYEMIEGCSTGVQKFQGSNDAETAKAFCEGLVSNELNSGCASMHRESAFKAMACVGTWPHVSQANSSGYLVFKTDQYSFRDNSCYTGLHYISANNEKAGMEALCRSLLDDELNLNCARKQREQLFAEKGCQAH